MCRERQVLRFKFNISSSRLHHQNAAVVMRTAQVSVTRDLIQFEKKNNDEMI
jgi:hypothetical protein